MIHVGIDIAKAKFDGAVFVKDKWKHKTFDNKSSGFKDLLKWLTAFGTIDDLHVCMESTGNYSVSLAKYLSSKTIKVSVVNPLQVKSFARSELSRNKTDKLDATLIARFCKEKKPRLWSVPSDEQEEFKALYRRWETLRDTIAQDKNRLKSETCQSVRSSIESTIAGLSEQLDVVEAALDVIVANYPTFKHRFKLLISIPGIAKKTAYFLLAEIDFDLFQTINQVVAFAGLNPKHHQSGILKGKSPISKIGSSRIRKALYFPAIAARKHNPTIASLALRLETNGHTSLSIICAAMRKLLHQAFGIIKSDSLFDPNYSPRA